MTAIELLPEVTLALPVKDRKAAADWYENNLGFALLYDAADIGWCAMSTSVPGLVLGFAEREEVAQGGPVPTFDVADVDAARARLEANGVEFAGPNVVHEGLVKLATFFDLDGHALMLAEDMRRPST